MTVEGVIGCVSEDWMPGIGDPNLTGWLTVLAYLICFVLALRVWQQQEPGRGFWGLIAILMALLAINKQLDLQSALTAAGRCLAKSQHWYANRRAVQAEFVAGLLALVVVCLLAGLWLQRRHLRDHGLAMVGLAILAGFVTIRAVGFHHIDQMIGLRKFGLSANYLLENAGLLLIAINAVRLLRGQARPAGPG